MALENSIQIEITVSVEDPQAFCSCILLWFDSFRKLSVKKGSRHWLDLSAIRVRVLFEPKSVDTTGRRLADDRRWKVSL